MTDNERSQIPLKSVAIYLYGADLNPGYVTEALGVMPTGSQAKGALKGRSKRFVAKIGMWHIEIHSEDRSVSELVDELFLRIPSGTRLDCMPAVESALLDILFTFDGNENRGTTEFCLTKEHVAKAAELGLGVSITVM